jgi:hypothetical protein
MAHLLTAQVAAHFQLKITKLGQLL